MNKTKKKNRKKAIVTIPNFGYWKVRFHLLLKGTMPITKTLGCLGFDKY